MNRRTNDQVNNSRIVLGTVKTALWASASVYASEPELKQVGEVLNGLAHLIDGLMEGDLMPAYDVVSATETIDEIVRHWMK